MYGYSEDKAQKMSILYMVLGDKRKEALKLLKKCKNKRRGIL